MRRFMILSAFFASAALIAPMAMKAEEHHEQRYYDRSGRDYHTWNDHEDHAYRVYLGEQHREYRPFGKVKVVERDNYFRWRHEHSDDALIKVQVR